MHTRRRTMLALLLFPFAAPIAAQPPLEGYTNYQQFTTELHELAESELVTLESLGTTLGDREVSLLTVSAAEHPHEQPGLLIVGDVDARRLVGSELAVRMVEQLIAQADEASVEQMLANYTLYVIPRPSPDASEHFFAAPLAERATNERPTDDDRDGAVDEDPPEDLNEDGLITMLRIADPTGEWMPHPDESRVLIEADPKKGEQGQYKRIGEGVDNDHDELWNEDGPGGVDFNRNFTYAYPFFEAGAGPYQVSEIETRAVADFAFSRPNIVAVFHFGPQDNLMHPWKSAPAGKQDRYQPKIAAADAPYLTHVAEKYQALHEGDEAPTPPAAAGDFAHWSWFHYGRWTFCTPGWWMPTVGANHDADDAAKPGEGAPPEPEEDEEEDEDDEKHGVDQINALRWFEQQKRDGFVDWTPIEHPDFPGQKVEVGGFVPYMRLNPPADQLDALAEKHLGFVRELVGLLPELSIREAKAEPLGAGIYRITATVINKGYLPTVSAAGKSSQQVYPVQIAIELPDGAQLLTGHHRSQLKPLAGRGGSVEQTWLVQMPPAASEVELKTWAPSIGHARATVKFEDAE